MLPPVPINPDDTWATGATCRTNLPGSTSLEYKKETQSLAARRLNPPPANRLPPRCPISKTSLTDLVPDSEDEAPPPTYTHGKSPFGPEREQLMANYNHTSEEREYRNGSSTPQQPQKVSASISSQQYTRARRRRNVVAVRRWGGNIMARCFFGFCLVGSLCSLVPSIVQL